MFKIKPRRILAVLGVIVIVVGGYAGVSIKTISNCVLISSIKRFIRLDPAPQDWEG